MFILLHNIKRFEHKSGILFYITDANICVVQVNNILDYTITIAKNLRLDIIQDYKKEEYYAVSSEYSYLTAKL